MLRCSLRNESTRSKESTKREEKKEQVELEWKKEGILYGGSMKLWNALKIYTREERERGEKNPGEGWLGKNTNNSVAEQSAYS